MSPRGVLNLRHLEQSEFRSIGSKDFVRFIIISKRSCRGETMNINVKLINIGGKHGRSVQELMDRSP
jgi:hypothetical protein